MKRSTQTALATTALFALLCGGCSGSSTGSSNSSGNSTPSGAIQGSAK